MKSIKKIVSVVLALMMVMGMSATVFAADTPQISVNGNDTRSYDVYQIFTGDFAEKDGKEVLSNVKWGKNGTGKLGDAVGADVLNALTAVVNDSDIAKLNVIKAYAKLNSDRYGTVNAENSLEVVPGYYLYVDKGAVDKGESYSLYVVEVIGGNVTIAPKIGTVTSDKKVKDANDTEGTESDWQDSADYDIGDAVPFKLTGTVPSNYDQYTTYYYAFHDTQSEGLTFNKDSVVAYVDNDKDGNKTDGDTVISNEKYTVKVEISDEKVTTFKVEFANLKKVDEVAAGSVIAVEYTSTLNENAEIGSAGNSNTMKLEYSNNPNFDGEGNDPTGTTPEDKAVVFTYQAVVNKVDQDNTALEGAGFTLYKKNASGDFVAVGAEQVGNQMTTFTWVGLDDGEYKIVETTTPAGYNTAADILFNINPDENGKVKTDNKLFTANETAGSLTTNVINEPGSTLPETGGMGTTILYIAGAVMILGAGVALVMRRRRTEEN